MKTGLGLYKKYRLILAYINLFRFYIRKILVGFDTANQLISRLDKFSVKLILKNNGATIGENCDIETGLTFHKCNNYSNLIIGKNVHIGKNCFFDLSDEVIIENNVVISMQCTFITHIALGKSTLSKKYPSEHAPIHIKNNSYIGAGTTILKGVILNEKCIVGAGSVVTNDILPFTIVGGIPAKFIKKIVE